MAAGQEEVSEVASGEAAAGGAHRKAPKLADKVDTDHKEHTISNMVAHTAGTASGARTLLGLALAPVTGGQSGI